MAGRQLRERRTAVSCPFVEESSSRRARCRRKWKPFSLWRQNTCGLPHVNAGDASRLGCYPWLPSSTPSPTSPSVVASSSSPARSTAARSRHGTTAAGGGAQGEHQAAVVAFGGHRSRRRRRPRQRDHPAREVWVASGHVEVFNDPLVECLNCHKRHRQDHMQEAYALKKGRATRRIQNGADVRDRVPGLRHQGPMDRAARLQHDAQDLPRPDRDRGGPALSASRDRAGHLRQLRERRDHRTPAPVRHRPDRQELPQRDHPRQLHLPHPRVRADGDGILRRPLQRAQWHQYWIDSRLRGTSTSASTATTFASTSTEGEVSHYSDRRGRHRVQVRLPGQPVGRTRRHGQPDRFDLSTHSKHSGVDLSFYDQATETRYVPYVIEPRPV